MTLADYLREKNLSDRDFGELIGKTRLSVYRYRTGKRSPSRQTIQDINSATNGRVAVVDWFPEFAAAQMQQGAAE